MNTVKDYSVQIIMCGLSMLRDEKVITQKDHKAVSDKLYEAIKRGM